jgi:calcineurin-like phosphoesterase family protein
VGELRQQDRTIWFLRDFRPGDRTNEVSLLSSRALTPKHFSTEYFQSSSPVLLWVSDTHFSEENHHAFPLESDATSLTLATRIRNSFDHDIRLLAGIIISGDITWKALSAEFDLAKKFIQDVSIWSPLTPDQIAVCPGNHDVKFSDDPADKSKPITVFDETSSAAYASFYQSKFYLAPNEFLSCGRRLLLGNAVPVDIVCLNSSRLQQLKDAFQGHGFIGDRQMEDAAEQMNWKENSDAPRAYRIVVLHHHLLPTTFRFKPEANYAYSVVLDAEALSRWMVKHRVDLVLHGHMHQPFCARVSRPIHVNNPEREPWHEFTVIGMGSSGVASKDLGEVALNTVGFLKFELDHLEVSVHSVHPVNPSNLIWKIDLPYQQKMSQ